MGPRAEGLMAAMAGALKWVDGTLLAPVACGSTARKRALLERHEVFFGFSAPHPGAVRNELFDVVLSKVGCEKTCNRKADATLG